MQFAPVRVGFRVHAHALLHHRLACRFHVRMRFESASIALRLGGHRLRAEDVMKQTRLEMSVQPLRLAQLVTFHLQREARGASAEVPSESS